MRKWIIPAAAVVVVAAALVARVSQSDARWHILSNTAINTNRLCVDGLRYTWASGETTTQPSATRPVGAPWWIGPVALVVQHAPSTTPSTEQDWFNAPLAGADVFEAAYRPTFNPTDQFWYPYSHVGTVPFRHPLASGTESVRLDPQPNGDDSSADAFEAVHNCVLFGRIDFVPGQTTNQVDFSVDGTLTTALLSNANFDATAVVPGPVRFGPTGTEAGPIVSSVSDVNGNGLKDRVFQFKRSMTGLACTSTEVELGAIDPATGKRFYETDSMQGINCPP